MLFAGVALHGICYDFFFVTGFIYTDSIAPKKIRSQAQSMLVFITQGLGMFIGYGVVFGKWGIAGQFSKVNKYEELNTVITSTRSTEELSFGEKLTKLFAVDMPDSVDPTLLSTTMEQWKAFWLFPALLAAIIAVLFFVAFWDNTKVTADE